MSNLRSRVAKKVLLLMCFVFVLGLAHEGMAQETVTVSTELWLRESAPDLSYDDDGLGIYNSNVPPDQRRISVLEFDLSGLAGSYESVTLDLYSMEEWTSKDFPTVSEAYIIDTSGVSIAGMMWNSYFASFDGGKVALDSLGAYNYDKIANEPAAYDTYMTSTGSGADLAKVIAETTGDDLLTIVILAVETGYRVRGDWEDDVYLGNRAFLTFYPTSGASSNPNPSNVEINVELTIVLQWSPGAGAISHNVYFGADYDEVYNASDPCTRFTQPQQLRPQFDIRMISQE